MSCFKSQRILITGACGTVGSELVSQLLLNPQYSPEEVICLDNDETDNCVAIPSVNGAIHREPCIDRSHVCLSSRSGIRRRRGGPCPGGVSRSVLSAS